MKIYMCFLCFVLYGCANIIPPSGGEKDTVPPRLVFSNPENNTTNFFNTEIVLKFDEYIQIKNSNMINLSPPCQNKIDVIQRGKELKLLLNCSLDSNTTYSINFGNSIVDLNEGNALKNFKYIFSTGSKIDSLKLHGKTYDLYSSKIVANSLVGIYQHADSLSPYYYAFSEKDGSFTIDNIKAGNYVLYAIVDENNNLKYDPGELISFPKNIEDLNANLQLRLFKEHPQFNIISVKNTSRNSIKFEHISHKDSIKILNAEGFWKRGEKISEFWFENSFSNVKYQLGHTIDSIAIYNTDTVKAELSSSFDFYALNQKMAISCSQPIKSIDPSKFKWESQDDYINATLIDNFTVNIPINKDYKSENLIVQNGAIKTVFNKKTDSTVFNVDLNQANYATLNIKYINPKNETIIEVFNEQTAYKKTTRDTITSFKYIAPGTYNVRIFQDLNLDGAWTSGSLSEQIKPEPIQIYPEKIALKSNWEIDVEIKK